MKKPKTIETLFSSLLLSALFLKNKKYFEIKMARKIFGDIFSMKKKDLVNFHKRTHNLL
jgi:hypothetical protein